MTSENCQLQWVQRENSMYVHSHHTHIYWLAYGNKLQHVVQCPFYSAIVHIHSHLQHPLQAPIVSLINTLKVVQGYRMAKKLLVEGKSEPSIDVEAMKHSHAQHTTNKVKVRQMLL